MKNYVIIDADTIQKRIEELEWSLGNIPESYVPKHKAQIYALKEILSQSIPLIPEIEKAFDKGVCAIQENNGKLKVKMPKAKQDYISNLKLDI